MSDVAPIGFNPTLQDACEATLLFHSASPWDEAKKLKWLNLTGRGEASTKVLCDTVRRALFRPPATERELHAAHRAIDALVSIFSKEAGNTVFVSNSDEDRVMSLVREAKGG